MKRLLMIVTAVVAFAVCLKLENLTLPDNVSSIGESAFSDCDSFTEFTIPKLTRVLNGGLFQNCDNLQKVNFHNEITSIGTFAFRNCTALTSISLPELITHVPEGLFTGCRLLESVTIPAGVKTVYNYSSNSYNSSDIFYGCISLKELIMLPETPPTSSYSSYTGAKFIADARPSAKIKVPAGSLEAYKTSSFWKPLASKIVAIETENE